MYKLFGSNPRKSTKSRYGKQALKDYYTDPLASTLASNNRVNYSAPNHVYLNQNTAAPTGKESSTATRSLRSHLLMPEPSHPLPPTHIILKDIDLDKTQVEKEEKMFAAAKDTMSASYITEVNDQSPSNVFLFTFENQQPLQQQKSKPLNKNVASKRNIGDTTNMSQLLAHQRGAYNGSMQPSISHGTEEDDSKVAIQNVNEIMLKLHSELQNLVLKEDIMDLKRTVERLQQQRNKDNKEHLSQIHQRQLEEKQILKHICLLKDRLQLLISTMKDHSDVKPSLHNNTKKKNGTTRFAQAPAREMPEFCLPNDRHCIQLSMPPPSFYPATYHEGSMDCCQADTCFYGVNGWPGVTENIIPPYLVDQDALEHQLLIGPFSYGALLPTSLQLDTRYFDRLALYEAYGVLIE